MYEVYSQQRPGRPWLAFLASAGLLGLAVAMAAALVDRKGRARHVELGEREVFPAGGVQARLPAGWRPIAVNALPSGVVAGRKEPGDTGREVFVFRAPAVGLGIPSKHGSTAVVRLARALGLGPDLAAMVTGPGPVGMLTGWTAAMVPVPELPDASPMCCLGRCAVAPRGEVLGVVVLTPYGVPPRRADLALLDQVSQSLELSDLRWATGPDEVMTAAGIRFTPPDEARFLQHQPGDVPRVSLAGGRDRRAWYLDVYRVPLAASRRPSDLVLDNALSILRRADPPPSVETAAWNDREAAFIGMSAGTDAEPWIFIQCVRTDAETGLLMVGRHEIEAEQTLRKLCHNIGSSAEVAPFGEVLDLEAARAAARMRLSQIARQGLSSAWADFVGSAREFVIRSDAGELGRVTRQHEKRHSNGTDWWRILVHAEWKLSSDVSSEMREDWLVREDGAAHSLSYRDALPHEAEVAYTEERLEGGPRVARALERSSGGAGGAGERYGDVDDTFACEPVLIAAAGLMSSDPESAPALFSTLEVFSRDTVQWLAVPLGRRELPGPPPAGSAWAVRVQRDYDPSPMTWYFDDRGRLLGIAFEGGQWQELRS